MDLQNNNMKYKHATTQTHACTHHAQTDGQDTIRSSSLSVSQVTSTTCIPARTPLGQSPQWPQRLPRLRPNDPHPL